MKSRSVQGVQAYLLYLNSNTEIAAGYACHDVISR